MTEIRQAPLTLASAAGIIIVAGFLVTSITSYMLSTRSAKHAILDVELPLTSDNVYSEIQKDLLRPIFVSSLMANDTFVRDWILDGEQDEDRIRRYLQEIKSEYGTITSFLVSEKTRTYYHADGILKTVSSQEPRDAWYFRVRSMDDAYEINVDPDLANQDTMTIFINYRLLDDDGSFLGATGVGLAVGAVKELIQRYQHRFQRTIYFVDRNGEVLLHGPGFQGPERLSDRPALRDHVDRLLAEDGVKVELSTASGQILLNSRHIPELNWILMVEQPTRDILAGFRVTLRNSLLICALVTALVVWLNRRMVQFFHGRLANMAMSDSLTGIPNRRSFSLHYQQVLAQARRHPEPLSLLLIDIDHFKQINDRHGHLVGDEVIRHTAQQIAGRVRESDVLCRWGGEEFLVLLKNADLHAATRVAESLRAQLEARPMEDSHVHHPVTISVGVTQILKDDTESSAVSRADQALYQAKQAGRNRVCTH